MGLSGFALQLVATGCGAGTLLGVHLLDVVALEESTLVRSQPSLGELVNAFVGRTATGLDHVEDATFVRCKAGHLPDHTPDHFNAGRCPLRIHRSGKRKEFNKENEREREKREEDQTCVSETGVLAQLTHDALETQLVLKRTPLRCDGLGGNSLSVVM